MGIEILLSPISCFGFSSKQTGVELRKLSPGAEFFGSCRSFALENQGKLGFNTLMVQDILNWSLFCNDWKQLQVTDRKSLSKNSAPGDSLRSSTP